MTKKQPGWALRLPMRGTCCLLCLATIFSFSCSQNEEDRLATRSINEGERIVSAVENYRRANDHYPGSLEDLVPDFLPEIPVTYLGSGFLWHYINGADAKEWFVLEVVRSDGLASFVRYESYEMTGKKWMYFRRD